MKSGLLYLVEPECNANGAAVGFSQAFFTAILPMGTEPGTDEYGDGYREALESMALALIGAGIDARIVDAAIHAALGSFGDVAP